MILLSIILFFLTFSIGVFSKLNETPFPDFDGHTKFHIRNSCSKSVVVFLDRAKPPCDKMGTKIPFGQCAGGNVKGGGWNDPRNGNVAQQTLLEPNNLLTINIPLGDDGLPEWCFDEAGRRICSGNGGWIGIDCEGDSEKGYHCKSGTDNGYPYWPNRFEPNFNHLNEVIFYNLSGVDGLNVNMRMFSTGTCADFDKQTTCNLDLHQCPYPDKDNKTCVSQCQACNRIREGDYPTYWNKNDFIDPSTGEFVNCNLLCAAGLCEDHLHLQCAQRVEGKNQACCKTGECGGESCKYDPVVASKKWCDYIHGLQGGECDIYCWAYDDAKGTRACGLNGNINLDITCSFNEKSQNKLSEMVENLKFLK